MSASLHDLTRPGEAVFPASEMDGGRCFVLVQNLRQSGRKCVWRHKALAAGEFEVIRIPAGCGAGGERYRVRWAGPAPRAAGLMQAEAA